MHHLNEYTAADQKSYRLCGGVHLSIQIVSGLVGCGAAAVLSKKTFAKLNFITEKEQQKKKKVEEQEIKILQKLAPYMSKDNEKKAIRRSTNKKKIAKPGNVLEEGKKKN